MLYKELVEVYLELEKTTKRLKKTYVISEFLKKVSEEEVEEVVLLLQGKVFPPWDKREIGVASRLVLKAINTATGINLGVIENEWKKTGDLGLVAEKLTKKKTQKTLVSKELTTKKVFNNLRKLASLEGEGTVNKKIQLIAELLTSAKPIEARYIIRTVLEELRIGIGAGTMRDAIVWANFFEEIGLSYDKKNNEIEVKDRERYNDFVEVVQRAYDLVNDFSIVAKKAKKGLKELKKTELEVGRPIKVMLALKVKDIKEGFERVGKPAELEYKYDGFRMQIHKIKDNITIFTRRLENVTKQFPEVVEYVKKNVKGKSFILDSEAVGYDAKIKKYLPFQNISQRIKRKYGIEKMAKDMPVELNVFDIIFYEGKNLIKTKFLERRKLLEKIITIKPFKIRTAKNLITKNEKEAEKFYKQSLDSGNEGVMFKNLNAPYKPVARVGYMVKLKPVLDTLDLVIVEAEWGEGKRAKWLSSFTLACIDENNNFRKLGKASTGLKEKKEEGLSFEELTEILKPLIIAEKGKIVKLKPEVVVQITYSEIQKSPTYDSGYALRFPRISALRQDRSPEEITTLEEIEQLFLEQKK